MKLVAIVLISLLPILSKAEGQNPERFRDYPITEKQAAKLNNKFEKDMFCYEQGYAEAEANKFKVNATTRPLWIALRCVGTASYDYEAGHTTDPEIVY